MRRISLLLLIAIAVSGIAMARIHDMDMSSFGMTASQCLDHCLRSADAVPASVPTLTLLALCFVATLAAAIAPSELRTSRLAHGDDSAGILLLKRRLASVILRN